ncbi:MAG: zinc-binding dehydrogenase [Acidimicrobiia bacterium]|nr:zinc-binding dehydrogenase [Acidimicrobiia bacterium]
MRAWVLNETNGPESFTLQEVPTPEPGLGEVRVRLDVSALNHLDLWVSRGMPAPHHFPHIAGADGTGQVDAIGEGVATVAVGNEVTINPSVSCGQCAACLAGNTPFCKSYAILGEHSNGTLAEYAVVPARNVVPRPGGVSAIEAGSYGLAYGTAMRMLRRAGLKAGDVLLVVGIGGGVSSAAQLIGQALGADVFVTSRSPDKIAASLELGATGGFDSGGEFAKDLKKSIGRGADVVIENVGPATWNQSIRSLEAGGRLAICGSTSGPKVEISVPYLFFKQLEIIGSTMFDHAEFARVTRLIDSTAVPVIVDSVYPFEALPEAVARLDSGLQRGKVAIQHG